MELLDFYSSKPTVKYTSEDELPSDGSSLTLYSREVYENLGDFLITFDTKVSLTIPDGYFAMIIEDPDLCVRGFNLACNVKILTGTQEETLKLRLAQIDNEAPQLVPDTPIAKVLLFPVVLCDFAKN